MASENSVSVLGKRVIAEPETPISSENESNDSFNDSLNDGDTDEQTLQMRKKVCTEHYLMMLEKEIPLSVFVEDERESN